MQKIMILLKNKQHNYNSLLMVKHYKNKKSDKKD